MKNEYHQRQHIQSVVYFHSTKPLHHGLIMELMIVIVNSIWSEFSYIDTSA